MKNSMLLITLLIICGVNAVAAESTLQRNGSMKGRSFHKELYSDCSVCHDLGKKAKPSDGSCQNCHDLIELITKTARPGDELKSHNPHDSFHYGTDVPCMECHGEHSSKPPLCDTCHLFKYSNHKT